MTPDPYRWYSVEELLKGIVHTYERIEHFADPEGDVTFHSYSTLYPASYFLDAEDFNSASDLLGLKPRPHRPWWKFWK